MNDNKQNKEDKLIQALADLIADPNMTREKLRSMLDKAHEQVDAKKAESVQTQEAAMLDVVKDVIKSENSRVVIAACEDDDGRIEHMSCMAVGKGHACLALIGLSIMSILKEQSVSLKDFCDGMLETEKHSKRLKNKED